MSLATETKDRKRPVHCKPRYQLKVLVSVEILDDRGSILGASAGVASVPESVAQGDDIDALVRNHLDCAAATAIGGAEVRMAELGLRMTECGREPSVIRLGKR